MDSEYKRFIDTLKDLGISFRTLHQPSKEEWQLDLLKLGYNITSLATIEITIGKTAFLFMTGGGKFLCSRYGTGNSTVLTRRMGQQLFLAKNPQSPAGFETVLPLEQLTEEDKKTAFVTEKDITKAEAEYGANGCESVLVVGDQRVPQTLCGEAGSRCAECGLVVCKAHSVVDDRNRRLCFDCGEEEATRQMKADAPGVWPDWMPSEPKKEATAEKKEATTEKLSQQSSPFHAQYKLTISHWIRSLYPANERIDFDAICDNLDDELEVWINNHFDGDGYRAWTAFNAWRRQHHQTDV